MNISYAALAAIFLAGGTAVGFATGTRMGPDTGEEDRRDSVEIAALIEDQKRITNSISKRELALEKHSVENDANEAELVSQFEELSVRQEQVEQREFELDARSEQLEEKLASLKALEEDLARMYAKLNVDSEALEKQRAELDEQGELISAQVQSVLERESQLTALQQKLAERSAAIRAQELAQGTEPKLDLNVEQAASNAAISGAKLNAVALREPTSEDTSFGEGSQASQLSEAVSPDSEPAVPSKGPIAEVHFERNSARLTPGAVKRAREAADRLQNTKFSKIRIAGHTDTTGSASLNRALSNERAEAVAAIFVQSGFPRQMIEIVGFGETQDMLPVSTGDGISEPLNRCVGIFIEETTQSSLQ